MPEILIDTLNCSYSVTYSKRRKTICIRVVGVNAIELIVPSSIKNFDARKLLTTKLHWLKNQMARLKAVEENPLNQKLNTGTTVLFLGVPRSLKVVHTKMSDCSIKLNEKEILVQLPFPSDEYLAVTLESWYKKAAAMILEEKTTFWSSQLGVMPKKITIKDQKTRWGSCSSLGNINYNWRIVMAPSAIIDYLVIHELSHLIEPNHSQKFWKVVQRHCPNFKQDRKWLKTNGQLLMRFLK